MAESFLEAGDLFVKMRFDVTEGEIEHFIMPRDQWKLIVPFTVLHALAFELHMKCLLALDTNKIPQTHDYLKMFKQLTSTAQIRLTAIYNDIVKDRQLAIKEPGVSLLIEDVLRESKDAFVQFRYIYEHPVGAPPANPYCFRAHQVSKAVRKLILELQPSWGNVYPPTFRVH